MFRNIALTGLLASLLLAVPESSAQNWVAMKSGTQPLVSIHCTNGHTCFAISRERIFHKTTDGGDSWAMQSNLLPAGFAARVIVFTSDSVGFVGGLGGIYRSTNAGTSWTKVHGSVSLQINAIDFPSRQVGYAVSAVTNGGGLAVTTDGGATWSSRSTPATDSLQTLDFVDSSVGWVGGSGGVLLRTVTAGVTWKTQANGTGGTATNRSLDCKSRALCYVGTDVSLRKTVDSGKTWIGFPPSISIYYTNHIFFTDANRGYAAGARGGLASMASTTDGGVTWSAQNFPSTGAGRFLSAIHFPSPDTGYAVGDSGLIVKYVTPPVAIRAKDARGAGEASIRRIQSGVSFNLAAPGRVTISLRDLQGKVLRTLLDEARTAGEHRLRFDPKGLEGVYILDFRMDGMRETLKLQL